MDGESFTGESINPLLDQYLCNTKALLQSMPLSAWLAILQFWRLVAPYGGVTYETRPGLQNDVQIESHSFLRGLFHGLFLGWTTSLSDLF